MAVFFFPFLCPITLFSILLDNLTYLNMHVFLEKIDLQKT